MLLVRYKKIKNNMDVEQITDVLFYIFIAYVVFYICGITIIAIREFIIIWKEHLWETQSEKKVLEEITYLIYKHSDFCDLSTKSKIISASKILTHSNNNYRIDCYKNGIKHKVIELENSI